LTQAIFMLQKQVVIDDQLINYFEVNPQADTTVVFLHGWQSSVKVWVKILEKLGHNQVRLIALDMPGFGQSPIPKLAWGVGDYAELVKNFATKLELKNIVLVGHSFGGRVAIKLVSKEPKLIKKLVLVDAAGFRNEKIQTKLKILAAKTAKPLFALPILKRLKETALIAMGAKDYVEAGPMRQIFMKTINEDLTDFMHEITIPTLLIWGEKDEETPLAYGEIMNRLIPDSKLVVLAGAGHFSFLDEPDHFVKLIHGLL